MFNLLKDGDWCVHSSRTLIPSNKWAVIGLKQKYRFHLKEGEKQQNVESFSFLLVDEFSTTCRLEHTYVRDDRLGCVSHVFLISCLAYLTIQINPPTCDINHKNAVIKPYFCTSQPGFYIRTYLHTCLTFLPPLPPLVSYSSYAKLPGKEENTLDERDIFSKCVTMFVCCPSL